MNSPTFHNTNITHNELTEWILSLNGANRINEIRYFGSRVCGNPRPDSDIDVYLLLEETEDDDDFSLGVLFSKRYKGYTIEFHPMYDFHDEYVPSWLLQCNAPNQLPNKQRPIETNQKLLS